MYRKIGRWSLAVLALALCPATAVAQAAWDQQKGTCESTFQGFDQATLPELKYCMGLWQAYRNVGALKPAERASMAKVFQRLHDEGDPETRFLAKQALSRLGFTPEAVAPGQEKKVEKKEARKRYRPHTVPKEDQKAAAKIGAKALAAYKRQDYDGCVSVADEALAKDPRNVQALYDLACCHALLGHRPEAVENLLRLGDLGTKESLEKVRKARTDKDFEDMRDDPEYKRASGYAKIKFLNGMPADDKDLGADSVYKLVEIFQNPKLGYKIEDGGDDKHTRDRPHIWYKEHSKAQAFVLFKIINHPRTRFVKMDWDSPSDLIVSWADKVEIGKDGQRVARHSVAEKNSDPLKAVDSAMKESDQAMREPDQYLTKVDQVVASPGKAVDKLGSTVDKVTGAAEKATGVVDKVKGVGGKLGF